MQTSSSSECADVALSFRRTPGNEPRQNYESALQAWCSPCCCAFISLFHTLGPVFEPLQMLVGAWKSMHSNRDKRDLVLDNSGCLSLHYSLEQRDIVTTVASAGADLETKNAWAWAERCDSWSLGVYCMLAQFQGTAAQLLRLTYLKWKPGQGPIRASPAGFSGLM